MFFDHQLQIVYLVLLLLLIGAGIWARQPSRGEVVRYGGIWLLIIAGLMLFYQLMLHFTE